MIFLKAVSYWLGRNSARSIFPLTCIECFMFDHSDISVVLHVVLLISLYDADGKKSTKAIR